MKEYLVKQGDGSVGCGDVSNTLSQRASRYGCFEDVARITQMIIDALNNYSNYKSMPNAHKESIHMIASKIARICCGDHNYKDSWHDISGYAKLIEGLIGGDNEQQT